MFCKQECITIFHSEKKNLVEVTTSYYISNKCIIYNINTSIKVFQRKINYLYWQTNLEIRKKKLIFTCKCS